MPGAPVNRNPALVINASFLATGYIGLFLDTNSLFELYLMTK